MAGFVRCEKCTQVALEAEVNRRLGLCPSCGHHRRLTPDQWISILLDGGDFTEINSGIASGDPLGFEGLADAIARARRITGRKCAIVTGNARIGCVDVVSILFDYRFVGGTIGSAEGEKIALAFEHATCQGLPVIGVVASGGARVQEGLFSLMQVGKILAARSRHREAGLQFICVLTDPSMAGSLIGFAMAADIVLAEPGARIGFAGARVSGSSEEGTAEQYAAWKLLQVVDRTRLKTTICGLLSRQPK